MKKRYLMFLTALAGLICAGVAIEQGCGPRAASPSCQDGQVYSGSAGRCITPE